MVEGREGDWECSGCRNRNYAFRSICNRCRQFRLLVDTKTPADSKWLPRIGDWICSGCSNNNYASREKCNKCCQLKEVAAMPAIAMPGVLAHCNRVKQCRDGDWMCTNCHNHNFASRSHCNRCKTQRDVLNQTCKKCNASLPSSTLSSVVNNTVTDLFPAHGTKRKSVDPPGARLSWADMADELKEEEGLQQRAIRPPLNGACDSTEVGKQVQKKELTREQREYIRFMNVQRKKDFICLERVRGRMVNVLEGLELHCGVFSAAEQKRIVDFVLGLQEKGKNRDLKARTYTAPEPWMRGKGRVTIQFACCYNYATDKKGNPPGILRSELVDPIPDLFKVIIRRMVRWHVLPPSCVPDSCIVNIYEEGNCIPPHIDSHDFVRPFCTVSFLSECNIVFGSTLKILGPGEFSGSTAIPLPVGSVLVFQGNGADVAKHCVPAVQSKRISITFRKMDESKRPIEFIPEADLQGIQPLAYDMDESNTSNPSNSPPLVNRQPSDTDELKITYPTNSPPRVNRRPVSRDSNSERRRVFPGRGSGRGNGSEPRHSATPNRHPSDTDESKITYPLNSSPQVNRQPFIREGSSERRKEFLGRGSESEPRYSTPPNHANQQPVIRDRLPDSGKGILGRGGQSEPPRYSNTRQSQQSNRPRVRMSLGT